MRRLMQLPEILAGVRGIAVLAAILLLRADAVLAACLMLVAAAALWVGGVLAVRCCDMGTRRGICAAGVLDAAALACFLLAIF